MAQWWYYTGNQYNMRICCIFASAQAIWKSTVFSTYFYVFPLFHDGASEKKKKSCLLFRKFQGKKNMSSYFYQ